jgi:hypothetical protein
MEKKFFVPAVSMLAGVFVWIVFLVFHETVGEVNGWSTWLEMGLCLAAGGLIVFSGFRCRQVGGPRIGNIVRTIFLIVMTAITYWRVGNVVAAMPAAAAIVTGVLVLMATHSPEVAKDAVSSSAQVKSGTD